MNTKMRQSRIERYFPSDTRLVPSGRSFLDLPSSVRKLIYEYVELDDFFVDLNYTNLKVYPKGAYPETLDCRKLDWEGWHGLRKLDVAEQDEVWEIDDGFDNDIENWGPLLWNVPYGSRQSLLLASKEIHDEVEAISYAGNVFRVCFGQPLGFTRLLRMSDNALSHLGSLTIRLDVPKTEVSDYSWANNGIDWYPAGRPAPLTYLDVSTKWGVLILKNWNAVLERLVQLTRPDQLRLRVIFRAKTIGDAKAIIEPLMRLLPQLKDFGICVERAGHNYWWMDNISYAQTPRPNPAMVDTEISQIVQQVVQQVVPKGTRAHQQSTAPFRYLDLPQEIRFGILEYTDLVSPYPVQWRPRNYLDPSPCCNLCWGDHWSVITTEEGEPLCNCKRRPARSIEDVSYYPCCKNCSPDDFSGICYCSIRGPIWSTSCTCISTRPALLFVSSQVRRDAIPVYYACNQILVTSYNSPLIRHMGLYGSWLVEGKSGMPKIELSLYLSSIARNAFQYIRWLEWILPDSERSYLLPRTKAWFDYLDTILLMQHAMKLSALTFTVNMGTARRSQYKEDWIWFEKMILPFRALGDAGLKDFFVHLPRNIERGMRKHHERDLERAVMGKGYNSAKRGKPVERISGLLTRLQAMHDRDF